ncbi:mobilization protein [Vibrio algivorus]|uniref:Mobilization protein n=2 Tax=Vibrio algivorus TaxID=1667024 RepID=A0A557NSS5_9VIBR|nr:mobilization protein [Vibrio algivorus]
MSEILDLAKTLERKSKQRAERSEVILENAFNEHEQHIKAALQKKRVKISNVISQDRSYAEKQSTLLKRAVLRTWIWLPITLITVLILAWGIAWGQGKLIERNWQTISEQNRTIEKLKSQGGNIQISNCDNRTCVQIDESAGAYQDGYRIPQGY